MDVTDSNLEKKVVTCSDLLPPIVVAEVVEMEGLNSTNLCGARGDDHSSSETGDYGQNVGVPHFQLLSFQTECADVGPVTKEDGSDTSQKEEKTELELGNPERCCNCNALLELSMEPPKKIQESVICEIFHLASEKVTTGEIKIKDMLKVLCHIETKSGEALIESDDLLMCTNCVDVLKRLFELYNEFLTISIRYSSVLAEAGDGVVVVNLLQKRINAKATTVDDFVKKESIQNKSEASKISRSLLSTRKSTPERSLRSSRSKTQFQTRNNCQVLNAPSDKEKENEDLSSLKSSQIRLLSNENQTIVASIKLTDSPDSSNTSNISDLDATSDTCNRCGKRFKTFGGLKVHYASHVRDDKKVSCKECGKKFKKIEALEMHERIDHKGYKPHKCPHDGCERSFRLKDKLKLHIKVIHEKRKPFPCPKCEKSFRTKYHLKAHDVAQHVQGDTSIGCTQCRRKFPTKDALEIHIKTHTEEKRFICQECNKGFKTSSRLKLHAKSHDALPSAVCATCGKAYKHIRDLRLHEVIHEGESSYRFACGDCPRKFYRIDLLRVHQSNEKHFSPETIGPCVSKITDFAAKTSSRKSKQLDNSKLDKAQLIENKEDVSRSKKSPRKKQKQQPKVKPNSSPRAKANDPLYDCLGSPTLFPTMVPVESVDDTSHGLEIVELTPALANASIINPVFRRNGQNEMSEPSSYILSTKDPVITNLASATNIGFNATLPQTAHFSLSGPATANLSTIYTAKDSSDRSLPSFSISAGAEQIGFDVINAFINNLN